LHSVNWTEDELRQLSQLSYIEVVHRGGESSVTSSKLTPELAAALAKLPRLRYIDGWMSNLGGSLPRAMTLMASAEDVELLGTLPYLEAINLSCRDAKSPDLSHLLKLTRLKKLALVAPNLLIDDIQPLASHPALANLALDISATKIEKQ